MTEAHIRSDKVTFWNTVLTEWKQMTLGSAVLKDERLELGCNVSNNNTNKQERQAAATSKELIIHSSLFCLGNF
jgi:hypothetical protein